MSMSPGTVAVATSSAAAVIAVVITLVGLTLAVASYAFIIFSNCDPASLPAFLVDVKQFHSSAGC